ncbi:MAG: cell division protein FtsA [Clostridia bacterium]
MSIKHTDTLNINNTIFALDIGTRTVVGIVGMQEKNTFRIIASEVQEHQSRAMMDGQVHDVEQVAIAVEKVKKTLEKKTGMKLDKVAIAAAGRVLRTKQINVQREIDPAKEIDRELVKSLEMEGMQIAQMQLDEELSNEDKMPYYCVGYDTINYYLNNYVIGSLIGHKGKTIGADILATFLPHTIVDSLYSVMKRVDLEVISLTLEPIAAINVAIPKDLRLLNLALIDIGAGTSDIAITKSGSVVAYAMVPVAGDEITELICQNYLIDFNTGEKIKVSLSSSKDSVSFTDIMGNKQTKKTEEIIASIQPAIEFLADTIAQKILEYNKKAPNAVFLVGGGSQISCLPQLIAHRLNLPMERVAVRNRSAVQNVKISGKKLLGPEAITPIGIAVTAQMQRGQDFIDITVNEKTIRLFNTRNLNVSDALVLIGFNAKDLIGKRGKSLVFEINEEQKTLKGDYGESAQIFVNGKTANLETDIKNNDDITIKPAQIGKSARLSIKEVLEYYADFGSTVKVNGETVSEDYFVQDGDKIETFQQLSEQLQTTVDSIDTPPETSHTEKDLTANKNLEPDASPIIVDDLVTASKLSGLPSQLKISVNGKPLVIDTSKKDFMFVDIFNYIDFDLSNPQGSIALKLNGRQAGFTDLIRTGDDIEIGWEK